MKRRLSVAIGYVRDQVQRRVRRLVRRMRILKGRDEYAERRELARKAVPPNREDSHLLSTRGYVDIALDDALAEPLIGASREKLAVADSLPPTPSKAFFSNLLSHEDRTVDSVYIRTALHEETLRMVGAYLGVTPFLESVDLLVSKPLGNGAPAKSQLWHRDRTDAAIVKLFIYVNDVGDEHGPFVFLSKEQSSKVPEYLPHYVSDERMERHAQLSQALTVKGEAGKAFLVDTSNCYHLGSRCEQPRLAYIAYYSSGFGYFPRENAWHLTAEEKARLSRIQQLALGHYD
jgi:hypothetical protein